MAVRWRLRRRATRSQVLAVGARLPVERLRGQRLALRSGVLLPVTQSGFWEQRSALRSGFLRRVPQSGLWGQRLELLLPVPQSGLRPGSWASANQWWHRQGPHLSFALRGRFPCEATESHFSYWMPGFWAVKPRRRSFARTALRGWQPRRQLPLGTIQRKRKRATYPLTFPAKRL